LRQVIEWRILRIGAYLRKARHLRDGGLAAPGYAGLRQTGELPMPKPALHALVLLFLWGALIEDATIFALSWLAPDLWFRVFHHLEPAGLEVALLRRAGGQWAAFALVQAIALWQWRSRPAWLLVVAGARISDLFTDLSYVVAAPSLTTAGWAALSPPPLLNAIFVVVMLLAWRQAHEPRTA
jgi:hypothetical protein